MKNEELRMKKSAIKREQSDACISYAERKQARYKVSRIDFLSYLHEIRRYLMELRVYLVEIG
jgi:hypothetical protein